MVFNSYSNKYVVLVPTSTAQNKAYNSYPNDLGLFSMNADSIIRYFGISHDEYARQFMKFMHDRDNSEIFSDDLIYINYFLPLFEPDKTFM